MPLGEPKILALVPVLPDVQGNGLIQRTGAFLEAACAVGDVHCFVFPVYGPSGSESRLTSRLGVTTVIMNADDLIGRLGLVRGFGGMAPTFAEPDDPNVRRIVQGQDYDLIYLARVATIPLLPPVIRNRREAHIVLDLDEYESPVFRRMARLRRLHHEYDRANWEIERAQALDHLLSQTLPQTPTVTVSSSRERALIAGRFGHGRVVVIPNPAPEIAPPQGERRPRNVVFVGNFSYFPNLDAATWLLGEIWPRIRAAVPGARLVLAGQGYAELAGLAADAEVDVIPNPPDIAEAYADAAVAVVPLRAGGGTRIKVLEAAQLAIPIVSTRIGIEGLNLQDRTHLIVADDALSFALGCISVFSSRDLAERRAARARDAVMADHARSGVITRIRKLLSACMSD